MLFFDIDGTLITEGKNRYIPESTIYALAKAKEKGHRIFINTGRVFCNLEGPLRALDFDGYVCGCGTYIVADGQLLLHKQTSRERCRAIAQCCRENGLIALFEHADHNGYDKEVAQISNLPILEYFMKMDVTLQDDITADDFCFDKFAAWYDPKTAKLDVCKKFLEEDFTCIQREGDFIEVVPKGYSKATGIQRMLDFYQESPDKVYVFGDSNNDLDMLKFADNSIAMGVCTPQVKAVATYQTDRVEDDGILHAMEHFGLI
ncbi:MAG: HAD family hydrolase [Wujia sp.]